MHDGTLTGLKVEVEDTWVEARVDDRARLWSRKLRLTPTGRHAERARWAPRNYVFGFWGTWDSNERARELHISPADAWSTLFDLHGHKDAGHPDNVKLRFLLDSRDGRHYADNLLNGLYDGKMSLPETLCHCGPPPELDMPKAG